MTAPMFIFDIDGTIADSSHRAEFVDVNWDEWHAPERIAKDSPLAHVHSRFVNGRFKFGDHVFLTGRSAVCRDATRRWLVDHGFATHHTQLYMRPDGNDTKVCELKVSFLLVLSAMNRRRPIVFFEDHEQTVNAVVSEPLLEHVTVVHAPHATSRYLEAWDLWGNG